MTLPHLRPYIELSTLLGTIYVVQNFDHVFTITAGATGSANLPYFVYQTFYTAQDYGRASAAGVVTVAGTLVVAMLALARAGTPAPRAGDGARIEVEPALTSQGSPAAWPSRRRTPRR